jgi:threonine dehydrogenase-like Zn-dependent dehydrogenase
MKAAVWHGKHDVRVDTVPDPILINPRDAIVKITSTAICGSDLHLYDGFIPAMQAGDILGHEFMGEIVDVGKGVRNLKPGDRVVVPFTIACGGCFFCMQSQYSLCENSNPNAGMAEKLWVHSPAGIFGYSHLTGGYAGGQAEYARIPFADVGPIKIDDALEDDKVLFLSDILPTGYMAAENCDIRPGDVVAVWGCGPVGQFAIQSAYLMGKGLLAAHDRVRQMMGMDTDRPLVLREVMRHCRNGGTISVPGVYGGLIDKVPMGSVMNRALTIKTGQTHVQRYLQPLLERIRQGDFDPERVITHRLPLGDASDAYRMFRDKQDACVKVVLKPWLH